MGGKRQVTNAGTIHHGSFCGGNYWIRDAHIQWGRRGQDRRNFYCFLRALYVKRAYASGMQITIGNSAGVAAPFLFADSTEPRFIPGYAASIATLAVGICIHASLSYWFHRQNKNRAAGKEDWKMEGKTAEEVADMGDLNPLYRYTI